MSTLVNSNSAGHGVRLQRIFKKETGRTLIIPLDHGITSGPIAGLSDVKKVISDAAEAGADAIMLRPGLMDAVLETDSKKLGIILRLTGRLERGVDHVQLNSVEHAIRCGADAVCAEFKLGSDGSLENAKIASEIAERAHAYGLPVLLTIYAMPEYVKKFGPKAYENACRIGEELGANFVKTALPPDPEVISNCLKSVRIPIVIAGGETMHSAKLLEDVQTAVDLGIAGAAIGRNVWGNDDPILIAQKLSSIIHEKSNN